jgi:hypothetical protein
MSKLKRLAVSAAAGVAALAMAAQSHATAIVADSGWQDDTVAALNTPSTDSPITFSIGAGETGLFSLSDCCIAGDIYKVVINGVITATSTFTLYSTPFNNDLGPAAATYAPDWLDSTLSHLQLTFGPGDYSLVVEGNGAGGFPAGVGERLDVLGIPEPATWLTMLFGFGALGLSMRNTRRKQAAAMA